MSIVAGDYCLVCVWSFIYSLIIMGQLPGRVDAMLEGMQILSFLKPSLSTHAVASYKAAVPAHLLAMLMLGTKSTGNSTLSYRQAAW